MNFNPFHELSTSCNTTQTTHLTESCLNLERICDPSQTEDASTMAPRPRTYGTRRSHAKAAGEVVNGTPAEEPDIIIQNLDEISAQVRNCQAKDLRKSEEEKQGITSQDLGKGDELATGTHMGEPSHMVTDEETSIPVSPTTGSLKNRRMSAQDMFPPEKSIEEKGSRRKSARRLVNGSGTLKDKRASTIVVSEPISLDQTLPSHAEAYSRPNGFTKDQQSPVGGKVDLKDAPSDLHDLAIWVAHSISILHDNGPLSTVSEPSQNDFSSHPEQDIETSHALDDIEDVRMTRGKKRKRMQQLKGTEPVNGRSLSSSCFVSYPKRCLTYSIQSRLNLAANILVATLESSREVDAGLGDTMRPRDAARNERWLKDNLNDELKQRLFGSSVIKDSSTNDIERNACGKLLFNTLVDLGVSTNHNSAAALRSALNERKDNAPFHYAFQVLASSSEIMAFIKYFFSKDTASRWEVSNADESRPSTGAETSGATTVTETSALTSRAGTSISDAQVFSKVTTRNKAIDNRNAGMLIVLLLP